MFRIVQLELFILIFPLFAIGQGIDYDSTFQSNGMEFRVQQIQFEKYLSLLKVNKKNTVILSDTLDFITDLQLIDFNRDNAIDIRISYTGNVDRQSLYLFNQLIGKFQKVIDFERFPHAKEVKGQDKGFYYSYHRSGCADNYWTSDLFKIIDYKVIHMGQIFGEGCEAPMQVKVYKVGPNKKHLIETLPYKLVEDSKDFKWGFIENYWSVNYSRFK